MAYAPDSTDVLDSPAPADLRAGDVVTCELVGGALLTGTLTSNAQGLSVAVGAAGTLTRVVVVTALPTQTWGPLVMRVTRAERLDSTPGWVSDPDTIVLLTVNGRRDAWHLQCGLPECVMNHWDAATGGAQIAAAVAAGNARVWTGSTAPAN